MKEDRKLDQRSRDSISSITRPVVQTEASPPDLGRKERMFYLDSVKDELPRWIMLSTSDNIRALGIRIDGLSQPVAL